MRLDYAGAGGQSVPPPIPEAFRGAGQTSERPFNLSREYFATAPPEVKELISQATISTYRGDLKGAEEAFKELVRISPSADSYALLAHNYFKQGEYSRAAINFEKAVKRAPRDSEALFSLGLTYYQLGKLGKAVQTIRKVVKTNPDLHVAHFLLGYLRRSLKQWQEAEASYREAIRLSREFSAAYQYLALLYIDHARDNEAERDNYYRQAIATFEEVVKVYPKAADALYNIGNLYGRIGEPEKASEAYQRAIEVVNEDLMNLTDLGTKLLDDQRYREARGIFNRALEKMGQAREELGIKRALLMTNYGVATMGMYTSREAQPSDRELLREAEESYLNALSLEPGYIHAQNNLGAAYYEQGRINEAIQAFEKALELDPNNRTARDNLKTLMEERREKENSPATAYEHIVFDQNTVPMIEGTNMKVVELVLEMNAYGWSPEELQFQHPYLSLGQIHSALAYYWDHVEEIDSDIERRLEKVNEIRRVVGHSRLKEKLMAKGLI